MTKPTDARILKTDDEQRLVFGWASVSLTADGQLLTDLQSDVIYPEELEKCAYDFVLKFRAAGEMHDHAERRGVTGTLVESFVCTPEKLAAMGLQKGTAHEVGWWVGFKFDAESYARVKSGDYSMFSIQGTAERQLVEV